MHSTPISHLRAAGSKKSSICASLRSQSSERPTKTKKSNSLYGELLLSRKQHNQSIELHFRSFLPQITRASRLTPSFMTPLRYQSGPSHQTDRKTPKEVSIERSGWQMRHGNLHRHLSFFSRSASHLRTRTILLCGSRFLQLRSCST